MNGRVYASVSATLQKDLDSVAQWITENNLILNTSKTKTLLFGTRQKLADIDDWSLHIYAQQLEKVSKFHYLGELFDENLTWKGHVEQISIKASKCLGLHC